MLDLRNPWLSLGLDTMQLCIEAQQVVAMRFCRLALAGPSAHDEYHLMVSEKVAGFGEAAVAAGTAAFLGGDAPAILDAGMQELRRRVIANKARLSR